MENKWISPQLLAGYGGMTWLIYHAMTKVSQAFANVGNYSVHVGGVTGAWGHIAASSLFVPIACASFTIPLIIHVVSYIPRKMQVEETQFRSEPFEFQTHSSDKLVDPGREDKVSPGSVVSVPQSTAHQVRRSDGIREDRVGEMGNVIFMPNKTAKPRPIRHRRPKGRQ